MGGVPGRLIALKDRQAAIALIQEAMAAGARLKSACDVLEITPRTLERWLNDEAPQGDKRSYVTKVPANRLTAQERAQVLAIATSKAFADLSPSQIVPQLADKGHYIASESTFYRVLKAAQLHHHRGRAKPKTFRKPKSWVAKQPNEVWSWDISVPQQAAGEMRDEGPSSSACRCG